ncbi:RimJ/RimL family protein N-acetyltransferase [Thermocatellispora tengchongensis]|uniref:RimJ/RimL family protein N-acetyltransferase n=2 Tax=Thermocatellispora tengchongensis TaxID=1073253 RepID=A0A840P1S9_9ACTN|nr:GNAT family N-acetyltransferase [Thermocatellispora tengchongensis]MBB5131851.1 RimJ/RimL family protein N-acetyltransferase [Thermocatellispora tengchongensis]
MSGVHLETERLVLRRLTPGDAGALLALHADPEVMRYLTGGRPATREEVEGVTLPRMLAYYERYPAFGYWAADRKGSGEFLGWFHFRPAEGAPPGEIELGYRLHRAAWGKGYASEGSRALIRKGFTELGVERVVAQTMAVNLGSRRVMEKCGLRFVRAFHHDWPEPIPGSEHGEVEYALTRADWEAGPAATG